MCRFCKKVFNSILKSVVVMEMCISPFFITIKRLFSISSFHQDIESIKHGKIVNLFFIVVSDYMKKILNTIFQQISPRVYVFLIRITFLFKVFREHVEKEPRFFNM